MTSDEAGRLQDAWRTKHGGKACHHNRVVDHLITSNGQTTGKLACKECGAIFPDLLKSLPDVSPPS